MNLKEFRNVSIGRAQEVANHVSERLSKTTEGVRLASARHLLPRCVQLVDTVRGVLPPEPDIDLEHFRIQQTAYASNFCVVNTPLERQTELWQQIESAETPSAKITLLLENPHDMLSLNLALIDATNGTLERISDEDEVIRNFVADSYPELVIKRVWRHEDPRRSILVTKHCDVGGVSTTAVRNRILTTIGDETHPIAVRDDAWARVIVAKREYLELPNGDKIFDTGNQSSKARRFIEMSMEMGHGGVVVPKAGVLYAHIDWRKAKKSMSHSV